MIQTLKRSILFAVIAMCAIAVPAAAQDPPKAQFSGGYQFLRVEEENINIGWFAEVDASITRAISVTGLVSGGYKSFEETETFSGVQVTAEADLSVHTFMGGVRYHVRRNPAATPFAHVLLGGVRGSATVTATGGGQTFDESESSTDFGLLAGGGVNIRLNDRFGLRVGADFLRIFADDEDANGFRFTAGVVFPFSR